MLRAALLLLLLALAAYYGEATVKCVDPSISQPDYCCNGIVANLEYSDTCECNRDWNGKECTCNGIVLKNACHSCMVHLPGSNKWDLDNFAESELFGNCKDCVDRCREDIKKGMCVDFQAKFFQEHYTTGEVYESLCTHDALKKKLFSKTTPLEIKRALYAKPVMDKKGFKDTRFDWKIPGFR